MPAGVLPGLEMVADEDGIEPDLLGGAGERPADSFGPNCSAEALYPSFSNFRSYRDAIALLSVVMNAHPEPRQQPNRARHPAARRAWCRAGPILRWSSLRSSSRSRIIELAYRVAAGLPILTLKDWRTEQAVINKIGDRALLDPVLGWSSEALAQERRPHHNRPRHSPQFRRDQHPHRRRSRSRRFLHRRLAGRRQRELAGGAGEDDGHAGGQCRRGRLRHRPDRAAGRAVAANRAAAAS